MARPEDPAARDRILSTAARLFYAHGVRAVGLAQIIDEAGCGKNLLYRHFSSKGSLAAAYLQLMRAHRDASTARAIDGLQDPKDALVALVGEIASRVRRADFRGCAFRTYLSEFPGGTDEPAQVARDYLTDTRRQVDDLVAQLGRPRLLADRIWLLIDALYAGTATDPQVAVDWVSEIVQ